MGTMFFRQAVAALIVYDISKHETFDITAQWIDEVVGMEHNAVIALVGNKCDLEDKRTVTRREAEALVQTLITEKHIPAFHMECSAKTGQNIENLFKEICIRLLVQAGLSVEAEDQTTATATE